MRYVANKLNLNLLLIKITAISEFSLFNMNLLRFFGFYLISVFKILSILYVFHFNLLKNAFYSSKFDFYKVLMLKMYNTNDANLQNHIFEMNLI